MSSEHVAHFIFFTQKRRDKNPKSSRSLPARDADEHRASLRFALAAAKPTKLGGSTPASGRENYSPPALPPLPAHLVLAPVPRKFSAAGHYQALEHLHKVLQHAVAASGDVQIAGKNLRMEMNRFVLALGRVIKSAGVGFPGYLSNLGPPALAERLQLRYDKLAKLGDEGLVRELLMDRRVFLMPSAPAPGGPGGMGGVVSPPLSRGRALWRWCVLRVLKAQADEVVVGASVSLARAVLQERRVVIFWQVFSRFVRERIVGC